MHEYLRSHIREEIEGAIDYMSKAIELKKAKPEWATKFFRMSEMEVEHATCMTKMFNSVDKPEEVTSEDFSSMQKDIIDVYTTSMSKIETMKKIYWS